MSEPNENHIQSIIDRAKDRVQEKAAAAARTGFDRDAMICTDCGLAVMTLPEQLQPCPKCGRTVWVTAHRPISN